MASEPICFEVGRVVNSETAPVEMIYRCLSIILKSDHSPLTSGSNRELSSRGMPLTRYFFFHYLQNLDVAVQMFYNIFLGVGGGGIRGGITVAQQFLQHSEQPVWHQQLCHIQSHLNQPPPTPSPTHTCTAFKQHSALKLRDAYISLSLHTVCALPQWCVRCK